MGHRYVVKAGRSVCGQHGEHRKLSLARVRQCGPACQLSLANGGEGGVKDQWYASMGEFYE